MAETKHSSDMVERVSMAISFTARIHGGIANPDEVAKAALEASHHAEAVKTLDWVTETLMHVCQELQARADGAETNAFLADAWGAVKLGRHVLVKLGGDA